MKVKQKDVLEHYLLGHKYDKEGRLLQQTKETEPQTLFIELYLAHGLQFTNPYSMKSVD